MADNTNNFFKNIKLNFPKYELKISDFPKPETPPLAFTATQLKPLKYEDTLFKKMADDIKSPIEQQLESIESIADSARKQAESSESIAYSAKDTANAATTQADIAVKTSKKADVKGWLAVIIAGLTLFVELTVHHNEVLEFINKILQLFQQLQS